LGLTKVQLGWLGSSFAWVYGLGAPFAGTIVDRVQRKTAILAGLQAWSIICMATALARTFPHLLFFRAAEGLGETFYYPAATSLISDYHGQRTRSRALGIHQTKGFRKTFLTFGVMLVASTAEGCHGRRATIFLATAPVA
jgi:MFS family permease